MKTPAIFGDHMVLQEGRPLPFWGTAAPGEEVTVKALGQSKSTTADKDGRWKLALEPLSSREPFEVTVAGKNTRVFTDVVTGEVWLGSGQSNMEWPLAKARNGHEEVEAARQPRIRLFQVRHGATLPEQADDVDGRWQRCDPESAAQFSAVAFFFGRELLTHLDRPIGLINSSWGGTPAEAWTSQQALAADPGLRSLLGASGGKPEEVARERAAYREAAAKWERENIHADPGNQGERDGWASVGIPGDGWKAMDLPGFWEDSGLDIDGAVWFRKDFAVPAAWVGKPLSLRLGQINDCDTTYVNGEKIGGLCHETPTISGSPRRYEVPARLVKAGRLLIAVRVFDERGRGGFGGAPAEMKVSLAGADASPIPLAGRWLYRVESALPSITVRWDLKPKAPASVPDAFSATHLYNQLLAPLIPFAIRGVIWYQGEANTSRAFQYRTLFPALIRDWRRAWGQGDFPFLFVQLANFHARWSAPGGKNEEEWAELREAQTMALALPATGMAVTVDIGNRDDIHPTNKQEVGRRLSLWARGTVYGEKDLVVSGPLARGHTIVKDTIRVTFTNAVGLRNSEAGPLIGFEIAGPDRRFVAGAARIDGDAVVVSAPGIKHPASVRYAWSDSPVGTLVNGAGLPASPFRTDAWPGLTIGRK